ncbi:MAG: hypothetical protein RL679_413 [Bacteroidota bacterium]
MKIAISIVLMGFFTISFAQKSDSTRWLKVSELEMGQDEKWALDGLENCIITSKNVIQKYDSAGVLQFFQSSKSFGRLTSIQSINPMKWITFSEEQQLICLLDNTMTLSEQCIDLSGFGIGNATHIAVSSQSDKLWVLDQLNSRLLLLSLGRTNQFQEISNLKGILNISMIASFQEWNNQLFLCDAAGTIYQFDVYGSLLSATKFENIQDFAVKENNLVLVQNNQLLLYNLAVPEKKLIDLPIKNVFEVKISGNFFYFRTENKIYKYTLLFNQ